MLPCYRATVLPCYRATDDRAGRIRTRTGTGYRVVRSLRPVVRNVSRSRDLCSAFFRALSSARSAPTLRLGTVHGLVDAPDEATDHVKRRCEHSPSRELEKKMGVAPSRASHSTVLLAIGDPVLDLCTSVDEAFVADLGWHLGGEFSSCPGACTPHPPHPIPRSLTCYARALADPSGCDLIDEDALNDVLARLEAAGRPLAESPGGSAANVAKCFARLANSRKMETKTKTTKTKTKTTKTTTTKTTTTKTTTTTKPEAKTTALVYFAGTLGNDDSGRQYRKAMEATGVAMSHASVHGTESNGVCLCLVTESGERTMRTALRASKTHELVQGTIDGVRPDWAHFEGYYVYKPTIVETMERLKGAGAKISFDFASFDVIASQRDLFERVLDMRLIDVLFCNEQEAVAFSSLSASSAPSKNRAAALSPAAFAKHMAGAYGLTMVVSRGASGCVAAAWDHDRGCVVEASAPAPTVEVVDTIGAGDHFSAGFLYALSHGGSLEDACACGCIAGAAAVQVAGSNVDGEAMRRAARDIADRLKTG